MVLGEDLVIWVYLFNNTRERKSVKEIKFSVKDRDASIAIGVQLGNLLAAGDLVMLSGGLGAGKTTFTKGIARGLRVRGSVSSPTFIVARVHPSLGNGPDLIHADAYRINDLDDLETLDLESSLADSVTVIEWGEGKTEAFSDNRLEIEISRPCGGQAQEEAGVVSLEHMDDGRREIIVKAYGQRWETVDLTTLA